MNEQKNILLLIKEKKGAIILSGLFVAAFSFLFLMLSQKNYKVSTDFLVIQNGNGSQDVYTLSKSAEYVGKVLNEAVYSELFINETTKTGKVNPEFLPFDQKEKLKTWSNIVHVGLNSELGMMNVSVFDNNQKQAIAISNAITEVITTKNNLFRGEGQNIEVKVLSGPVLEKNPSVLNVVLAIFGGYFFGVLICIMWLYYRAEKNINKFNMQSAATFKLDPQNYTKHRMENSGIFADSPYHFE